MADSEESTRPQDQVYDVTIVGAGIAGLSAAIYTTRERLETLVLEKYMPGGQILTTARVENYPGFPEPVNGMELADRLTQQAKRFGAVLVNNAEVTRIEPTEEDGSRFIDAYAGETRYRARTMILAVGSEYRKLNAPGEKRLTGYGVSYCGTCDAPFYQDKHVIVVGAGNTAVDEGLHLLKFVDHITFVGKGKGFRAEGILVEELKKHEGKYTARFGSTVTEILGDQRVEAVEIKHIESGATERIACDGVFVFIGLKPLTDFLKGTIDLDDRGFVNADPCRLETNVPGIWAAGDSRSGTLKQAATAAGDGVVVALVAGEYLKEHGRDETPA